MHQVSVGELESGQHGTPVDAVASQFRGSARRGECPRLDDSQPTTSGRGRGGFTRRVAMEVRDGMGFIDGWTR